MVEKCSGLHVQGMEVGHTEGLCSVCGCGWMPRLLTVISYLESVVVGLVLAGHWLHGASVGVLRPPAPSTDWPTVRRGCVKHQLIALLSTQPPPPLRSSGSCFNISLAQWALQYVDIIYHSI